MEYDGHKVVLTNGYYDVYYPDHPNARKNGSVMLQILVAEKMLGRCLRNDEVVHHKDCNRLNNTEDNLMIFASQADHSFYHHVVLNGNSDDDYVLYRVNGVYHCKSSFMFFNEHKITRVDGKRVKPCPYCGKLIEFNSKTCVSCRGEVSRKVSRPSRGVLKSKIRTIPFVRIADEYGVSDNAVRKWCRAYGLPCKSSDIKMISSRDWKYL